MDTRYLFNVTVVNLKTGGIVGGGKVVSRDMTTVLLSCDMLETDRKAIADGRYWAHIQGISAVPEAPKRKRVKDE